MFEIKKHLIKVDNNRYYLPVSARLVWFRQEHPDWGIETKPVTIDLDNKIAIFEATVYDSNGKMMATGTKMESAAGFPAFIEAAETGAIGRALAVCGYGTQFAPDLDEMSAGRVVDSPQPNDTRHPYTPALEIKSNPAQASSNDTESKHACSVCDKALTKGQEALSLRNYGIALCPNCQKDRKAGAAETVAAG